MISWFISVLLALVPVQFLLSALRTRDSEKNDAARHFYFSMSAFVTSIIAVLVSLGAQLTAVGGAEVVGSSFISISGLSLLLLVLVTFVGVIVSKYSDNYLSGEPRLWLYYRSLHLTLAAVTLVVISNHLLLTLFAWIAISLNLHRLLMFYPDRPRAALAAHKKFLFARLSELSMFVGFALLYSERETLYIDQILHAYADVDPSWQGQLAAVFLVITALIKCAQLPVHGWLIQVVEAPTPVSALLHAGIINMGGFLLLLFAPVLMASVYAQVLLLVVASLTTLIAGLVIMTRVSVKVRLAWSTSAQMGLMLVECALGLFELAALHLVAHSCYKAYAFLNAGSAVEINTHRKLLPSTKPSLVAWFAAMGVSLGLVAPLVFVVFPDGPYSPWLLLVMALSLVIADRSSAVLRGSYFRVIGLSVGLVSAYLLLKSLFGSFVFNISSQFISYADVWFCLIATSLFSGYLLLRYAPDGKAGRKLWQWLYAGLYLDEWATKMTLAVWPTKLPSRANPKQASRYLFDKELLS